MIDATCYATRKTKSILLCEAFTDGVRANGGKAYVCLDDVDELRPGAAVFYGVRPHQLPLLEQAKAQSRDWFYIDNAYFDKTREQYFRVTRNRMQHNGEGVSDGKRFAAIREPLLPWRKQGAHVLLCPQSDEFMRSFCPLGDRWTQETIRLLRQLTSRELRVREWRANKVEWYRTLPEDLDDCWALVTFSSASAITAMCAGIPAFVTAQDCICRPVANLGLRNIVEPTYAPDILTWANVVADNQFTVDEIANGNAWRATR